MNEERNKEEGNFLPGTPPLVRGSQPDEFSQMRGEVQKPGMRVLAVPDPGPPAPIGIAPPDPRNVVSNFDTRPVGAYDFAITGFGVLDPGEVDQVVEVTTALPSGYTAVLRRVLIETLNGVTVNLGSDGSNPPPNVLNVAITRNNGVIPNNTRRFIAVFTELDWPTHHVYGFWEVMGVRISGDYNIPQGTDTCTLAVTFMGTLIPTKSKPPATEIASDPVIVRDYDTFSKQPPDTGAAGSDRPA